ncbi:MAG: hypothetical protein GY796_21715 [Chloroflexi bacterium]|nr:hypothetical protein [Chloroflexota bacterium]
MATQEVTNYVIRELSKRRSRNDIIKTVCEMTGVQWDEAENFVTQVELQHSGKIHHHQNTVLLFVGIAVIIAGIATMVTISIATFNGLIILFLLIPIPYLGNLAIFGMGFLMAVGGIIGLLRMKS